MAANSITCTKLSDIGVTAQKHDNWYHLEYNVLGCGSETAEVRAFGLYAIKC